MKTFLVRVRDKVNPDKALDAGCCKRGFIVSELPDWWQTCIRESTNPDWRVLVVPDGDDVLAKTLLMQEIGEERPNRLFQIRQNKLDLDSDKVPRKLAAYLAYDSRQVVSFTVTSATLTSLLTINPIIEDVGL